MKASAEAATAACNEMATRSSAAKAAAEAELASISASTAAAAKAEDERAAAVAAAAKLTAALETSDAALSETRAALEHERARANASEASAEAACAAHGKIPAQWGASPDELKSWRRKRPPSATTAPVASAAEAEDSRRALETRLEHAETEAEAARAALARLERTRADESEANAGALERLKEARAALAEQAEAHARALDAAKDEIQSRIEAALSEHGAKHAALERERDEALEKADKEKVARSKVLAYSKHSVKTRRETCPFDEGCNTPFEELVSRNHTTDAVENTSGQAQTCGRAERSECGTRTYGGVSRFGPLRSKCRAPLARTRPPRCARGVSRFSPLKRGCRAPLARTRSRRRAHCRATRPSASCRAERSMRK